MMGEATKARISLAPGGGPSQAALATVLSLEALPVSLGGRASVELWETEVDQEIFV